MAEAAVNEEGPSMEHILQTIRGVISGDIDGTKDGGDVLELTEIVKEDGSIETIKPNIDILSSIDQTLGVANKNTNNTEIEAGMSDNNDVQKKEEPQTVDLNTDDKNLTTEAALTKILEQAQHEAREVPAANEDQKPNNLLSEKSAMESQEALKNLLKTVHKPVSDGLSFRTGTSLEDVVVESIRPFLSDWLDKNLPQIVRSLVEKEIKKLIPRDDN